MRALWFAAAGDVLYNSFIMKIGVIGTGYVGLVTGTCFAELGNDVICVDVDEAKVRAMQEGRVPIYEPGLQDVFDRSIAAGRLRFTTDLKKAAADADVLFLALPTPPGEDGSADLSYVLGVADDLGPLLKHYTVIVDKSTVPVGTAEQVRQKIAVHATVDFDVVSNPEFLREGFAVYDFMAPDRIVIGTSSERARTIMADLYEPITREDHPIFFMDERSAELTKYASNSFLAMKITFMNQIANLCEAVGADVDAVRLGVGSDERIGQRFLFPGIGYGGSCFPKDVLALTHTAREAGCNFALLETVISLNRQQQKRLTQKVLDYYNHDIEGKTFALWGLSFKPDTDDVRQAPALDMAKDLISAGARVVAYDPEALENTKRQLGKLKGIAYATDQYGALKKADALLIATEWPQFESADLTRIKKLLASPVIFDGRNIFSVEKMANSGFYYASIGRPTTGVPPKK